MENNIFYKEPLFPVNIKMNIRGVPTENMDADGKIKLNWFDGKIKVLTDCNDFVFMVLGMEEALIKALTVYTLNKEYITKINIEEKNYENQRYI